MIYKYNSEIKCDRFQDALIELVQKEYKRTGNNKQEITQHLSTTTALLTLIHSTHYAHKNKK